MVFGENRLVEIMEHKAFKILCNVKTQWIFMLSIDKWILPKYKSHVVHMFEKQTTNFNDKSKLEILCGIETFIGFTYILPMLEHVQFLFKFVQAFYIFIWNFIEIVEVIKRDLYMTYVDLWLGMRMGMDCLKLSLALWVAHLMF